MILFPYFFMGREIILNSDKLIVYDYARYFDLEFITGAKKQIKNIFSLRIISGGLRFELWNDHNEAWYFELKDLTYIGYGYMSDLLSNIHLPNTLLYRRIK